MPSPWTVPSVQKAHTQAHLEASLIHGYAMPEDIIEVDSIVRTKEGSVDPEWLRAKASSDKKYIGPRNSTERRVQGVIAAFLELPEGVC